MDLGYILNFAYEIAYFLGVLVLFLVFAVSKGRQAVVNIIFGLYLALLISLVFPYYNQIFESVSGQSESTVRLVFFAILTILTTKLCARIMPDEFQEEKFESFDKKLLLAASATILVMIFSFHVLPVTELLTPGTPIQSLFAPEQYFFWWLLVPLAAIYFL